MIELTATLLGTAHVERNGAAVSLFSKQAEALLYCLLTETEVPGQKAAALMGGEAKLRDAISSLNAELGPDFLSESKEGVLRIRPEYGVRVDLACLQEEQPENVEFYRGDFLENFRLEGNAAYNAWADRTREALKQTYMDQLRRYIAGRMAAHRYGACEKACERMLKLNPLDETAHFHMMKIYQIEGEYTRARELFVRYRDAVAKAGAPAPGQEILALAESIPRESRTNEILDFMSMRSAVDCN